MNARIATLLSVVIISCSEEALVSQKPEPLPQSMLQFQDASLTIVECQEEGFYGELKVVKILTTETPKSPTFYYVIFKYKATELEDGTFASRFMFHTEHKKFDGTTSQHAILNNSLDESGILTSVVQMEFEKDYLESRFKIAAFNDGKNNGVETATLEVTTTNPVSGSCPSPQLKVGGRSTLEVTIKDFN